MALRDLGCNGEYTGCVAVTGVYTSCVVVTGEFTSCVVDVRSVGMGLKDIDICIDIHISSYISRYFRLPGKGQYMRISGNI